MRQIIQAPDPILRRPSRKVEKIDDSIKKLAEEMVQYLTNPPFYFQVEGISAIQLGVPVRMIAIRNTALSVQPIVVVNPEASTMGSRLWFDEKCLSIDHGEKEYTVQRYRAVRVEGTGLSGFELGFTVIGLAAAVVQHECDHLNGVLISDLGELIEGGDKHDSGKD